MKKSAHLVIFTIVLIIIIGIVMGGSLYYKKYSYSSERADLDSYFGVSGDNDVPVMLQNDFIDEHAKLLDGSYYMDFDSVQKYFNDRFYYGKADGTIVYTTPTAIITAGIGTTDWTSTEDGTVHTEDYQIARMEGDTLYVALDYVKKYTNFEYKAFTNPAHMQIYTTWDSRETATVSKDTKLRKRGGVKSEILEDLNKGDKVIILETLDNWSKVKTEDSYIGYIENKRLKDKTTENPIAVTDYVEPEYTSQKRDHKINMGWHVIAGVAGNSDLTSVVSGTQNLNVISPTWFSVSANDGSISSFASMDYVLKAHNMGLEVWALVNNFSNEGVDTSAVLSSAVSRANLISQLSSAVLAVGADGINVDFESVKEEDGQSFIEFIRELSVTCRKNNLVLSVDNYVPMSINDHYDRKEQGIVADYVVIMGYDEHYAGDKEAGSVASIDYVEYGIKNTVNEVPADKVINGIPFYTRIWTTNGTDVSSRALGMQDAENFVANSGMTLKWDENTCQNYGEYTGNDGSLVQVWMEDADSIASKLGVMTNYNIGGVAEWRLGFETDDIWNEISSYLNQ